MFEQKLVYVCSPLRGDIEKNINKAKVYCKSVIAIGHIPIAPHIAFEGVLNDNIPVEREIALTLGLELVKRCDELWAFGNIVSAGMTAEIKLAKQLNIPTKKFLFDSGIPYTCANLIGLCDGSENVCINNCSVCRNTPIKE